MSFHRHSSLFAGIVVVLIASLAVGNDGIAELAPEASRRPARTFFVTRSLGHERLIPYLEAARPEIVQIGNYGAMFHGYADNPKSMKSPMLLPVSGERAALNFQRELNERVHKLGLTVVGHFRLVKVMADWTEQSGFVDYYNNRWPADLLGPKPHPELIELLQRDHGIDGVITTYNYRQSCACSYCQTAFREWLARNLTPQELKSRLNIDRLDKHVFHDLPVQIPGYPDAEKAGELDWLAMQWGAQHFKKMFDDIFIDYGRTLRKDLIVSQWNHLSHVSLKEERMFLPRDLWGRGEDYFWYSGGASFVGKNLNLSEGKAGDAWLSCLYARELSGGRPIVMGKYDGIRLAASMAEGYAMGGLGMGRYMRFENATGFEVLARYTNFMHAHRHLFDGAKPFSDAALVLPRQSVWNRHSEALNAFRDLGQALVERQVLLDVVADEAISAERLSRYPAIILANAMALSDDQLTAIRDYSVAGGRVFVRGETATVDENGMPRSDTSIEHAVVASGNTTAAAADSIVAGLNQRGASVIKAPWTVRTTAYIQPNRVVVQLVNYDRDETPNKQLTGPELERPKAVNDIQLRIRLPDGRIADSVSLVSPDRREPLGIPFQQTDGHAVFRVPRLLVYAVIAIECQSR